VNAGGTVAIEFGGGGGYAVVDMTDAGDSGPEEGGVREAGGDNILTMFYYNLKMGERRKGVAAG
jgi:hypothetical protein